ncbi:hypothetical protein OCK74_13415 [Chitinophagaceae bacterium LB-8]|uniref:DUF1579 domain-containing protein n=1 Tax=Paraflavisolibacter caeni TaxID=2982496 RepID=A0A9X3B8S0_9BACT|nr:hypothetical protein [Paraflavisolibacter caeni]MCU7550116.1 hypothetical protein [Paraflavisolibacter caeni]
MKKNKFLSDLDFLIGEWETEVYNTSFLPDQSMKLKGTVLFEWFEEQTFLIMRSSVEGDGPPKSVAIISQDDTTKQYQMLYYDERVVSRIYNMSLEKDTLGLWRDAPKFFQRFEGKLSADRKTIKGSWFNSTDGKEWQHDFNIDYQKIS